MTIGEHKTEFGTFPVVDWKSGDALENPSQTAYRIAVSWDDEASWTDRLAEFLALPNVAEVRGFLVGMWGEDSQTDSQSVVEALVAAHGRLPNLEALFIGDMTYEECEISWIIQSDLTPLLTAFPKLLHFGARGGDSLAFGRLRHDRLKSFTIETGGLPVRVLNAVREASFPVLEHLELWLGTEDYGWNGTMADVQPFLDGGLFPNLRYLGLRDSQIADEIAVAVAKSPLLHSLHTLDLSLGTLGDVGAKALLESAAVRQLKKLDLHHNYISEDFIGRFLNLGVEVDVSDGQEDDNYDGESYRYVAVGE